MSKQWARQQVRHDEVQDAVDRGLSWIKDNRQKAAAIAGGAALVLVVAGIFVYQIRANRASAWERLSVAQTYAYTGKPDNALEHLKQLTDEQPGSAAAAFATVFAGDLMFQRGKYKEAAAEYAKAAERAKPQSLQPVALSDLTIAHESAGDYPLAAATAQRFLDAHPDHFLAPQVHASLARSLQASGQADLAKSALQKIQLQYPDTSWAAWAQNRLKGS
jgi:TolA-binding protein